MELEDIGVDFDTVIEDKIICRVRSIVIGYLDGFNGIFSEEIWSRQCWLGSATGLFTDQDRDNSLQSRHASGWLSIVLRLVWQALVVRMEESLGAGYTSPMPVKEQIDERHN